MNETVVSNSGEHRWLRLAARQGYRGEVGLQLARRADQRYPHGMEMHAACEALTNMAAELELPLPEKA